MELRADLQHRGERMGVTVVLAEQDRAIDEAAKRNDDPAVLEGCARLMSESDAFFGMLFERHGTAVQIQDSPIQARAAVSFFEAELLEASITSKPICIVQSLELPPSAPMREFLHLVDRSLGHRIVHGDWRALIETFDGFCRALTAPEARVPTWLLDTISIGRVRRSIRSEALDPRLSFLGGVFREDGGQHVDETVLRQSLGMVEAAVAADGAPLGQLAKLSYLWIALRELARVSPQVRFRQFGDELQRTLQLWNSSAAWYGIHGSHPMGCLAALNELTHARTALKRRDMPLGARASAYYSIGTKLRSTWNARRFFRQSLALSRTQLQMHAEEPSNLLQMTGSAQARLARLGEPWRYLRALADFRKSLDLRIGRSAPPQSVAEAKNAYAYALFQLPWRREEALKLAAEAAALFRSAAGGEASGFYFRSERKRADMLGRARRYDEAISVAVAARESAAAAQALDQVRPLDQLIAILEAKRNRG
jgi:tetratricopeptide (TPR) repeat protein